MVSLVKNMRLRTKLLVVLLGTGICLLGIIGWKSYSLGQANIESAAGDLLTAVRANKQGMVEDYFTTIESQVTTRAKSSQTVAAMREFAAAFETLAKREVAPGSEGEAVLRTYYQQEFVPRLGENAEGSAQVQSYLPQRPHVQYLQNQYIAANPNPVGQKEALERADDRYAYHATHAKYHGEFRRFLNQYGYYDIFLVEPENGHIVYSVFKEVDYATSLLDGPYKDTNFARAFRAARDAGASGATKLVDFAPYQPSYDAPASFIASPIMENGTVIGVLVFQMPIEKINSVLTGDQQWAAQGLGDSGETYLVGDDLRMRNDSRFLLEDQASFLESMRDQEYARDAVDQMARLNTTILLQEVRATAAQRALQGNTGVSVETDYRGKQVITAYSPVSIADVNWGIVAKIDRAEALAAVQALAWQIGLWGGGLLLLTVGIALLFTRSFTRPIFALREAAQRVTAGDLEVQVPVQSRDEVGQLTRAFNTMVERNRDALHDAEQAKAATEQQQARLRSGVEHMLDGMERFEQGDLTVRLSENHGDDLGRLFEGFNRALDKVGHTMAQVIEAVETTKSTTVQISGVSEQLAAGVQEQAAQADEVAAAVEEMSRTIVNNAEGATRTAQVAKESGDTAHQNGQVVLNTVSKMKEVGTVIQTSAQTVQRLGSSSEEIGKIVATINGIAEQTNLLALNAAIEAARAGEHGQGFAVVADEVRELAERTATATREIESMIGAIQKETRAAVQSIQEGKEEVSVGVEMANQAGQAFEQIVEGTGEVSTRIEEIAAATEEQSVTSEQISRSVESISTVSAESARGVQDVAQAASELDHLTDKLRSLANEFDVQPAGSTRASHPAAAPA